MGGYQRYEAYRDSGVEWLGEIPAHWVVWKVTHGFGKIGSGTTPKSDVGFYYDGTIPWITTSELRENLITDTAQKITEDAISTYSALKLYPPESITIAMYGATIGRLGILGLEATVNQACCVFSQPIVFNNNFFYYWLWMRRPILISLSTGGGQPNLSQDDLKQLRVPIPPLEEQKSIARFLDYKTAQIDALIAKKESLLKKLAEKRSALISQAVTKGLDPKVPMKDSGVEWLGEIPAHWEIVRLRFLLHKIEQGWSPVCDNRKAELGEWGVLKVGCVNGEEFDENENKALPSTLLPKNNIEIHDGDILMSRANTKELVGSVAIARNPREKLMICDLLYRLLPESCVNKEYLVRLLRSSLARLHYEKNARGTSGSMQKISHETIKKLVVPLPPSTEQSLIVSYLDATLFTLNETEQRIKMAIARLKEYRTALIANAVTGAIDVRNVPIPSDLQEVA